MLERIFTICCDCNVIISKYIPIYIHLRRCSFKGTTLVKRLTDASTGLIPADLLATYPKGFFETRLAGGTA